MELEFEAGPQDQPIKVIINSEGQMIFPQDQLDYELSMVEFGEPEGDALKLLEKWEEDPIKTILIEFGVPYSIKVLFVLQSAEHAVKMVEDKYESSWRYVSNLPLNLSQNIKDALFEALNQTEHRHEKLNNIEKSINETSNSFELFFDIKKRGWFSIKNTITAAWAAVKYAQGTPVLTTASRYAVAYVADPDPDSPKWEAAFREEELWEINHFLKMMDVLYKRLQETPTPP